MALLNGNNPLLQAAVSASGIYYGKDCVTLNFPREFVSGDSFGYTVDGTLFTVSFSTTSDAMADSILAALVAITGSVSRGNVLNYNNKPRIEIVGSQIGHTIAFTLPTGTAALQDSTVITHRGIEEYGLLITSPFDVLTNKIVDTAGGGVVYTGYAQAGSLQASAVWAIKKETTVGAIVATTWASGVTNATFVWNDRAGYTYS